MVDYLNERLISVKIRLQTLELNPLEIGYVNKCSAVNDIISVKKILITRFNNRVNIYSDLKKFIIYYIKQMDELDFEYDKISINVVKMKIEFLDPQKRINLLNFFYIQLKKHGYEREGEECKKEMDLEYLKFNGSFWNKIKIIALYISQSLGRLLLSILFLFTITCIVMQPAESEWMSCFNIKYESFCSNSIFNHILNVLSIFFDFENGMKVTASCWNGVLLIAFGKLMFIAILLNYLVRKVLEKLKIE